MDNFTFHVPTNHPSNPTRTRSLEHLKSIQVEGNSSQLHSEAELSSLFEGATSLMNQVEGGIAKGLKAIEKIVSLLHLTQLYGLGK